MIWGAKLLIFCQLKAKNDHYFLKESQNNGLEKQALGALMRMQRAIVGAIWSIVTGVRIRSGEVPAPQKIMGN